jgi:hypothetical protein
LSLIPIDRAAFSYQALDWSRAVLLDGVFTVADCLSFETGAAAAIILVNCSSHGSIRFCALVQSLAQLERYHLGL